jgi:hypothetical protein
MKRSEYFNFIENKLSILATSIKSRGKLNILDYNQHSENFYLELINLIYNWELENLNKTKHNFEGLDLIDKKNKVIVSVSATCSKAKINSSLEKKSLNNYTGYNFKFISISRNADNLRKNIFNIPTGITFNPYNDIIDNVLILRQIKNLKIDEQERIFEFIKKELGNSNEIIKSNIQLLPPFLTYTTARGGSPNFFEINYDIFFRFKNIGTIQVSNLKIEVSLPKHIIRGQSTMVMNEYKFLRNDGTNSIYSFLYKDILYPDEENKIGHLSILINKSNYEYLQNNKIKLKLYYDGGKDEKDFNLTDYIYWINMKLSINNFR